MKLKEYLSVRGNQAALSAKTGLAPSFVWQMANEIKPVPIERCASIEKATNGMVSRKDLRPNDWYLIWPELIDK